MLLTAGHDSKIDGTNRGGEEGRKGPLDLNIDTFADQWCHLLLLGCGRGAALGRGRGLLCTGTWDVACHLHRVLSKRLRVLVCGDAEGSGGRATQWR